MLKIVGTLFTAAAILASAAQAAPEMIRQDVTVAYSDLNLSTEAGARALVARLDAAAKQACGGAPFFSSVYQIAPALVVKEFNTCRINAVTAAVQKVNAPLVHKVYAYADKPYRLASGQ